MTINLKYLLLFLKRHQLILSLAGYQLFDKIPSQLRGNDGSKQCECQLKGGSKQASLIATTEILTVSPPHRI